MHDETAADGDAGAAGATPVVEVRSTPATLSTVTPAPRRPMPEDHAISLRAVRAADQRIGRPGGERRQPMRGYEDTFTDIVDFILRVTHRIWEEKAVGYLYEHYAHNVRVLHDVGSTYGREAVIEATTAFLGAFPDMRLYADDIVWCGDEEVG